MRRAGKISEKKQLRVLAIDIGGTGLKASIVAASGARLVPQRRAVARRSVEIV